MDVETYVRRNEGNVPIPYADQFGYLTGGIGRKLSNGFSPDEVELMFQNDMKKARDAVKDLVPSLSELSEARQAVLIDMAFNMGKRGLQKFGKMLSAFRAGNFEAAANEIVDSLYYRQLPKRGGRNARMTRTGEWPIDY